jgi:hypothetical protein
MKKTLAEMVYKYSGLEWIYWVFSYYPLMWVMSILLVTLMLHRRNHANVLRNYIITKDIEYERKIEELQKGIVKLEKKIEIAKENAIHGGHDD